jgi:hypothetical protein
MSCWKDKKITEEFLTARRKYAVDKYDSLPQEERAGIDAYLAALMANYLGYHFKGIPSLEYRIDLMLVVGTVLNQSEPMPNEIFGGAMN